MVRAPFYDKHGLKKGAWSPEEDRKLKEYIEKYGHWNWRELPRFAGLSRCGKSCRLRWVNYLRPDVKRGNYTKEEDELIMKLHEEHGNKWSMIAAYLAGRTDNEIKNHWHTHLKKSARDHPKSKINNQTREFVEKGDSAVLDTSSNQLSDPCCPLSAETSSSEVSISTFSQEPLSAIDWISSEECVPRAEEAFEVSNADFWGQPFVADSQYVQNDQSMYLIDGEFTSPYALMFSDAEDLFYQVMRELPAI